MNGNLQTLSLKIIHFSTDQCIMLLNNFPMESHLITAQKSDNNVVHTVSLNGKEQLVVSKHKEEEMERLLTWFDGLILHMCEILQ